VTRCDIVMTSTREVFINGQPIGNVNGLNIRQDLGQTEVEIILRPTSLIFGEVPKATIDTLQAESGGGEDVDIARAFRNAVARGMGVDPLDPQHQARSVAPTPPAPRPVAAKSKRSYDAAGPDDYELKA
jgi:hypothetical protein